MRDGRSRALPDAPELVEVNEDLLRGPGSAAGRVSTALAQARIVRRQACYRPVTDDGLPLIGRVPGVRGAYVATGTPVGISSPRTGLALPSSSPRRRPRRSICGRSIPRACGLDSSRQPDIVRPRS